MPARYDFASNSVILTFSTLTLPPPAVDTVTEVAVTANDKRHPIEPAAESCQPSDTELRFTLAAADQAIFTALLIENSTVAANLTLATATASTIVPVYIDGEWPPLCASILYYNHLNSESIPATCGAYNASMCPMAWSFCRLERCRRGGAWVCRSIAPLTPTACCSSGDATCSTQTASNCVLGETYYASLSTCFPRE